MRNKRGNISILVIFVLLASSLLGILSMNFVQQMIQQSTVVHNYYKAYYLSKAGIELGLSQIKHRGIWFNYVVNTWDAIVVDNFFSGFTFSISTNISGTAALLSKKFWQDSSCQFPYILSGGDSLIVPLFKEFYTWWVAESFQSGIAYQNLADLFKNDQIEFISSFPWEVTFWMLILSGNELSPDGIFFKTWTLAPWWLSAFRQQFETYLATIDPILYPLESQLKNDYQRPRLIENWFTMYFMISNSTDTPQSFCVSLHQQQPPIPWYLDVLPTDTFFLESQASYGNQKVALDASYAQPIPGFLFNTYSTY